MNVILTIKNLHAQMASRPSKVDPNKAFLVPVYEIVAHDEKGETQYNFGMATTSKELFDKFQIGQQVEVTLRPLGKLIQIEAANDEQ